MIERVPRDLCCGCEACLQACPVKCVSIFEDDEGFLFPRVDNSRCIGCGKCEKTCPVLNALPHKKPLASYAYRAKDENLLRHTSSGGFFTLLAEKVISDGGVVFGAALNGEQQVCHTYVEAIEDLDKLRQSKYVQSRIGRSFEDCVRFLKEGREVLFCGSPCQIKALRLYLGATYANLTTLDFVCHGVPSPGIFRRYLTALSTANSCDVSQLHDISFRAKDFGHECPYAFSFGVGQRRIVERHDENVFLKGFLSDIYLRRSCHDCRAKGFSSGADYTMCDFWTVREYLPDLADGKIPGVSQVYVLNDKLDIASLATEGTLVKLNHNDLRQIQVWAMKSVPRTIRRQRFFAGLASGMDVCEAISTCSRLTAVEELMRFVERIVQFIKRMVLGK